jgi:ribosomal protein L37E
MSDLGLLIETHTRCPRCGVHYPQKLLSCPACLGFQKKHEQWIAPGKPKQRQQPIQEQVLWLDETEYPA